MAGERSRVQASPSAPDFSFTHVGVMVGQGFSLEQSYRLPGVVASGSNSVVESQPSKLLVAGPIPVSRLQRLEGLQQTQAGDLR